MHGCLCSHATCLTPHTLVHCHGVGTCIPIRVCASSNGNARECVASDMWRGNADTHACVCVQDARIPSQDAAYTLATLDDLCIVCNTCQFIPLRDNYNISRYHTCSHAAHGPNIAFQCVASDMWRGNAGTHAFVCVQDERIPSQDAAYTLAILDDLCTVCNTCQFIPVRDNYNISRYHTCSHASHSPNIAFQCVASDMWRGNADTHV